MLNFFFGRTRTVHIQFMRYLFVGGSSAVLYLLIHFSLTEYAGIHYLISAFIAYMLGLTWNYILGLIWVFESRHHRTKELLMILFIALGGLAWTELILFTLVEYGGLYHLVANFITLWLVLVWNFGMRRAYVFH